MTLIKNLLAGGTITALSCLLFVADLKNVADLRNAVDFRPAVELKNVIHDQQQLDKNSSSLFSTQSASNSKPVLNFVNDSSLKWRLVDYSAGHLSARHFSAGTLSVPAEELLTNELATEMNIENTFYYPELDQTSLDRTELEQTTRANIAPTSPATTPSIVPEVYSPEARKLMKLDDATQISPPLQITGQSGFAQQTQDSSATEVVYHF